MLAICFSARPGSSQSMETSIMCPSEKKVQISGGDLKLKFRVLVT